MRHEFLLERLVPDSSKSMLQGALELLGPVKSIGRWRRHIFLGVARAIEQDCGRAEDSFLRTPWRELPEEARRLFLYGMGERNITFAWKHSGGVWKHGGTWAGYVPELLDDYRKARNPMRRRQLEKYMEVVTCSSCGGERLNPQARQVRITSRAESREQRAESNTAKGRRARRDAHQAPVTTNHTPRTLPEVCALPIADAAQFFESLDLDPTQQIIAAEVLKEIRGRLGFLLRCGLDYLTLERSAPTLSGGESQRIRLAGQIGCGLVGVLYILDEPSIGLHPRDNAMLLGSLCELRDQGNTVVVVEHDEETMRAADHIVDFGPGPGVRGGEIVAQGPFDTITQEARSLTGAYLIGKQAIRIPDQRRARGKATIKVIGARHNNLKKVDVEFPLGQFICVTGVSGSGKSSLVNDILWEVLNRDVNGGKGSPGAHTRVTGLDHVDKAIDIDQSPIGRTPRSNPATYVKLFDEIRSLFTQLPQSKVRGYKAGRFSFNVPGGRCEACEGHGATKLEMDFLADIWVPCPVCEGRRFNHETLEVRYRERNIAEVLDMDVQEALDVFQNHPRIKALLQTLHDVGLDYLKLGQPSPTLSGGEAQRIKLARELGKRSTGKTIYLLDEPTTGLHFADVEKLLEVLHGFVNAGNTVLVVEHNLDVIKTADWIIDLGPEGGAGGGEVVAVGTPEEVAACEASHTGRALRTVLKVVGGLRGDESTGARGRGSAGETESKSHLSPALPRSRAPVPHRRQSAAARNNATVGAGTDTITIRGAAQHNLQHIDAAIPRDRMSVFCGPSGSGKSSLAMDTLYAEGQRRYVESLSSYARQFLGQMPKPKVEHIHGLSPAIAIEQKTVGNTPRSTVGTVTEIYDYLRVLYARLGQPYCPDCGQPVTRQTTDEIVDRVLSLPEGTRLVLAAPIQPAPGQGYDKLWQRIASQGFLRVRIDGTTHLVEEVPDIDQRRKHEVEVVVDRIKVDPRAARDSSGQDEAAGAAGARETRAVRAAPQRSRIADSIEAALDIGKGVIHVLHSDPDVPEEEWRVDRLSLHYTCTSCGPGSRRVFEELTPQHFSFNSPLGWCPACEGLGTERGTNLASLIPNPNLSLNEGAVAAWPDPAKNAMFRGILNALAAEFGIPLDVPYYQLDPRHQRIVLYGTGEHWVRCQWSIVRGQWRATDDGQRTTDTPGAIRFQYKGLYPAIEEASRVSFAARQRLLDLVGETACSVCHGDRVRDDAAAVRLKSFTLPQLCRMPLREALEFLSSLRLDRREKQIAGDLLHEATHRLKFLVDVGLEYLTLERPMPTLSGGESQRIRLAGQIGRALTGVLYVLDEPTIGLHPRDNARLIQALSRLRDLGNTVVLVEHDREVLAAADHLYDFGPGAGRFGGTIVADGAPRELAKQNGASLTGAYLSGKKRIPVPKTRRMERRNRNPKSETRNQSEANPKSEIRNPKSEQGPDEESKGTVEDSDFGFRVSDFPPGFRISDFSPPPGGAWLELTGARQNNLCSVDLHIPLATFACITGVSGSGKSSLIEETLARAVARRLNRTGEAPGPFGELTGVEHLSKVIVVDQQPLGSTPASNPATYTGVFDLIRELFARVPDARVRGYRPGRFSFNRPGGRCEDCEGLGQKKIEMHFLPDVWVECTTCRGKRFNQETLGVRFRGHSIADVLEMSIGQAAELFENIPAIRAHLATLCAIGLGYLTLGQSAPTLSGGEAQRVKLAAELARPNNGKTLYLLDEPTTGLHFDDIAKLLKVLNSLVEQGNTVVVIEHNLDIIKTADWIVDLGPEAGAAGGRIVAEGTPEDVVEQAARYSGRESGVSGQKSEVKGQRSGIRRRRALGQQESGSGSERKPVLRSYTGELLKPILDSEPRGEIEVFNAVQVAAKRNGDLDLRQVGKDAALPWQADGRRWHTRDRLAHNGKPCRWEGTALDLVIDALAGCKDLAAPNWNHRSIVEVMAAEKTGGWFLHAQTGDEWLLTLKFRVKKNSFDQAALSRRLDLKPIDDLDELAVYGRGERVRVKNLKGPWQEITVTVHWRREIDTPEFRQFLPQAVAAYVAQSQAASISPEDLTPWKVLGRKWHVSRKGFSNQKRIAWDPEVLETLFQALEEALPGAAWDWSNKQVVSVAPRDAPAPWALVHTKRRSGVDLTLLGEAGRFALGRFAEFGSEREITPHRDGREAIKLRFDEVAQVRAADFRNFLAEHAPQAVTVHDRSTTIRG
jgi:excinuclease ABC subunit A